MRFLGTAKIEDFDFSSLWESEPRLAAAEVTTSKSLFWPIEVRLQIVFVVLSLCKGFPELSVSNASFSQT
jgi:hypothetical protein